MKKQATYKLENHKHIFSSYKFSIYSDCNEFLTTNTDPGVLSEWKSGSSLSNVEHGGVEGLITQLLEAARETSFSLSRLVSVCKPPLAWSASDDVVQLWQVA